MSVSSATFSAALTAFLMVKDSKRKLPYLAQVLLTVRGVCEGWAEIVLW